MAIDDGHKKKQGDEDEHEGGQVSHEAVEELIEADDDEDEADPLMAEVESEDKWE